MRLNQRVIQFLVAAILLSLSVSAETQQPTKVHRIGYLSSFDPASESARSKGIWLALRELGYLEGQNIAIEYRYAEGNRERFAELAAELVRLKVVIILVAVAATIRAARNATKTIPIVMAGLPADPVEAGLVESLARPGGNVTGFTSLSRGLAGKRLKLFKEAVPKVARIAVLYESANRPSLIEVKEVLPVVGRALGLTIQPWEIPAADGFDKVFEALNKQRPDGIYVSGGALMITNQKRIVSFTSKGRLPSMYSNRPSRVPTNRNRLGSRHVAARVRG